MEQVKGLLDLVKYRSYQVGQQNYRQHLLNSPLKLIVHFKEKIEGLPQIVNNFSGEWEEWSFEKKSDLCYQLSIKPINTGIFSFRCKYKYQGEWYLDNTPYSYIQVIPSHCRSIRLYSIITSHGTFRDWFQDLERIQKMGFNHIHLLPLTQLGHSGSPYAASTLTKLDKGHQAKEWKGEAEQQLETLTQRAIQLKLGLCFDLVLNHVNTQGELVKKHPDWFEADQTEPDGFKKAQYKLGDSWFKWGDLTRFNFNHPNPKTKKKIWNFVSQYALFWAKYANQTKGIIRLDNFHSTDQAFFSHLRTLIRKQFPDLIIFAEIFSSPEETRKIILDQEIHVTLSTPWLSPFATQSREHAIYLHKCASQFRYLNPICSHDSETPTQAFGNVSATVPRYILYSLSGVGHTGITLGTEFGIKESLSIFDKQPYYRPTGQNDFSEQLSLINKLLESDSIFQQIGNIKFIDKEHPAVISFIRYNLHKKGQCYLVIINLDSQHEQEIELDYQTLSKYNNETLTDLFSKTRLDTTQKTVKLKPTQYYLFGNFSR